MTVSEVKEVQQNKVDELLKECNVFFAFSTEQFEEGKAANPLQEGDKYCRVIGGGFMPSSKAETLAAGLTEISNWYNEQMSSPEMRKKNIRYELFNHEAFYTGDIDSTLASLGEGYTETQVWTVYKEVSSEPVFWDNY